MKKLFVSYSYTSGFGNTILETNDNTDMEEPKNYEDITFIQELLEEHSPITKPIVLWWKVIE